LIGMLSTGAGSLYIERERPRDAVRVVHHMSESLKGGDLIAVFFRGHDRRRRGAVAVHANLLAGGDLIRCAGAARRAALCGGGHGRDELCAKLRRR